MLGRHFRFFRLRVPALAVLALLLIGSAADADEVAGEVYYQATYDNGSVHDLNEIPTVRQGIRRVVRIARFDADYKGYEVLTTEDPTLRLVHTGRTVKQDLRWNGSAWVAPQDQAEAAKPEAPPAPSVVEQEARKIEAILKALRERLKERDHAVAEAERKLAAVKGTDQEAAAAEKLKKARDARDKLVATIRQYEQALSALKDAAGGNPAESTGRIEHLGDAPDKGDIGIVKPTKDRAVLPHRVHVWKLPPGKGRRRYRLSMKHPEAGRLGAMRYLAYADTDGDGKPDKLLARSPLARAKRPGQWTRWSFITTEPTVFAGCGWPEPTAGMYCQRVGPRRENWCGTGTEVYVSPLLGAIPNRRWGHWPYLSNVRIWVNQNPDVPSGGPDVIFR